MTLLRDDLLGQRTVALAGAGAPAIEQALRRLGARLERLGEALDDEGTEQWARERSPLHVLVCDIRAGFATGGIAALRSSIDSAWAAVRGVAAGALIPGGGGAIVLLAPPPDAGPHAAAARAALENLARTLSVEWARYAVTVTAVAPGAGTSEEQLAELTCYLASRAGAYFSGCCFELGAAAVAAG